MHEDIKDLCRGYKLGDDVAFTASYRGKFDPAVSRPSMGSSQSSTDVVVDVEAVLDVEAVVE